MDVKRVLFIIQQMTPYFPESEISLIGRQLPEGMQERKIETRTFMPRFGCINERRYQLHEVVRLSGMNLIINDTDHPLILKVASLHPSRMQVYFIDNEDYFRRKGTVCDANGVEYADNDERSMFFVRGVLESIRQLRWIPHIIHCHGWMSALAALYVKRKYANDPCLKGAKIVYSIYSDEFKTPFKETFEKKLQSDGIADEDIACLKNNKGFVSLTKLAIHFSDGLIQGSKTINRTIANYLSAQKNKPFLPYRSYATPEAYMDSVKDFYNVVSQ